MSATQQGANIDASKPPVFRAARSVGVVKPQFDYERRAFRAPQLKVYGTGFWIKDCKVFVTCAHVVRDLLRGSIDETGMLVVGGNGTQYQKATVAILDFQHDLAILTIEASKEFLESEIATGLELMHEDAPVASEVAYAGFPHGMALLNDRHSPIYAEGVISTDGLQGPTAHFVQVSGPVSGGYSGSPIVLKANPARVVAVLANGLKNENNIFQGISWRHVVALCNLSRS